MLIHNETIVLIVILVALLITWLVIMIQRQYRTIKRYDAEYQKVVKRVIQLEMEATLNQMLGGTLPHDAQQWLDQISSATSALAEELIHRANMDVTDELMGRIVNAAIEHDHDTIAGLLR